MKKLLLLLLTFLPLSVLADDVITLKGGESFVTPIYCEPTDSGSCPDIPDELTTFQKKHGYQHPHRVEDLKEDCTVCHSMYGDDGLVTSRNISCASVDEFVPPGAIIIDTSDYGMEFDTTGTKVGYLPKGTSIKCGSCHEEVDVYVNGRKREFDFEDWRDDRLDQLGRKDDGDDDDDDDNGDGNPPPIDISDFDVFSELFAAGDLRADLNGDGVVDLSDFSVWRLTYGEVEPPVDPDPIPDPDPTPDPAPYQCDSKEMNEKHDFTPTPDTNCAACHGDGRTCD